MKKTEGTRSTYYFNQYYEEEEIAAPGEPVAYLLWTCTGDCGAPADSVAAIPLLGGAGVGAAADTDTVTASKYYYLNGQRIAKAVNGEFTWIHSDHLHSATVITDEDGNEVRRLAYRAFGEELENQGSGTEPKYSYTGKELDSSGLMYYGARYYDPALSRFITADTVYDGSTPQGLNRYSYVLNNPIVYRDPSGNFSIYVHTQGAGHVGVQVDENGELKNYDFGRYRGKYKYPPVIQQIRQKGPNVLAVTTGEPSSLQKKGGKIRKFPVSPLLDAVVASKFKEKFDAGETEIPEKLRQKMNNQKELSEKERYMGGDWQIWGPNCVTFSFDTLEEAFDAIVERENVREDLKSEAKELKAEIERMRSVWPKGVSNLLEEEQDIPPQHVLDLLPDSLAKEERHHVDEFGEEELDRIEE